MVISDIEDINLPENLSFHNNKTKQKVKFVKIIPPETLVSTIKPITNLPNGIPGTKKVFVHTWGCAHNNSDSEYMAGLLSKEGIPLTNDKSVADLWLLNSCTVKGPSQESFFNFVKVGKSLGKRIVVAGCVPQAQKNIKCLNGVSAIGVNQIDRVVEVVEETFKGNVVRLLGKNKVKGIDKKNELNLPKIRKNPFVEIIPINSGCLNACTYCKTKHARGNLKSYSIENIVERVLNVTHNEGVKEIWLTSEDLGAYGIDIGTNIAILLESIVKILPKQTMLRIGMTNPPYIMNHLEAIAKILNNKNVYSFLHIPVQCGSNKVLEDMKRTYTVEEFCKVVDYMKEKVPDLLLATDIICGFPTETEKDFNETMKLCEKYKFEKLHISQFYPRPGTPAALMKQLPNGVVKSRSRKLTKLLLSYKANQIKNGHNLKVLVTETNISSQNEEQWVGRDPSFKKVLFKKVRLKKSDGFDKELNLLGKYVIVNVKSSEKCHLLCTFVKVLEVEEEKENICEIVNKKKNDLINNKNSIYRVSNENKHRLIWLVVFLTVFLLNKYLKSKK